MSAVSPVSLIVDTSRIQYVAIIGSAALLLFILELTRKGKIRVQYAILWFFAAGFFLAISIWRQGLDAIARCMGVAYPPAALFLILIIGIVGILIHFSIVLSSLSERMTALVQEIGILRLKMRRKEHDAQPPDEPASDE